MRMMPIIDSVGETKRVHPQDGELITARGYATRETSTEGVWCYTVGGKFSELPEIYRRLLR